MVRNLSSCSHSWVTTQLRSVDTGDVAVSDQLPPVVPTSSKKSDSQLPAGRKTDAGVCHVYMLSDVVALIFWERAPCHGFETSQEPGSLVVWVCGWVFTCFKRTGVCEEVRQTLTRVNSVSERRTEDGEKNQSLKMKHGKVKQLWKRRFKKLWGMMYSLNILPRKLWENTEFARYL